MNEKHHPDLGYIIASKYRQDILAALINGPLCPTEVSKKTKYPQSHVSKNLSDLAKRGLIECINPNDRKGRLYSITNDGKKVYLQLRCHYTK